MFLTINSGSRLHTGCGDSARCTGFVYLFYNGSNDLVFQDGSNWAWDSVCMQLWMDASGPGHAVAPGGRQMAVAGALFRNKSKPGWGKAKWPSNKHCFAFNHGEVCNAETCRYTHKCKQCGGPHAFLRCNKRHSNTSSSMPTPTPTAGSVPAGPRPTWYRK